MAMSDADTVDLLERFDDVVQEYVPLAAKLGEDLEKFGKLKRELEAIVVELEKRGIAPKENQSLVQIISEKINERESVKNGEKPDSR